VNEIEEEIAALMELRDTPAGLVRITLSHHALSQLIWPKLRPVLRDYPDIKLELSVDGGFRNIVEDGFDAGVRLGESVEHDMIALRVGPDWRLVAVASPAYVAAHGRPQHPQDLLAHDCINRRLVTAGGLYAWEFEKDGKELRVRVEGRLTLNDEATMVDAALDGLGIAYVPEDMAAPHLESGALVVLLDDWSPRFAGYHIYYPSRRQNLPAFKVVVNALRD
jgi:DNA-binding transcriptional LysR family regulator